MRIKLLALAMISLCLAQVAPPALAQVSNGQRGNMGRKHPRLAKLLAMRRARGGGGGQGMGSQRYGSGQGLGGQRGAQGLGGQRPF